MSDVLVIINPISGTGGRREVARQRAELAAAYMAQRGVSGDIRLTERAGHARELAAGAVAARTPLVVAWGGDGTLNEVASVLAFHDTVLALVPSGSGNGLARELRVPFDAPAALAAAFDSPELVMDAGELDGRLFFNVAGIGLDARVAHEFAAHGLVRRGFARYLEIAARELLTFVPDEHTVVADGVVTRRRALLIAIANSRQYGNGATIAPRARLDDGQLDVVIVDHRSPLATLWHVPKLFAGRVDEVPGVMTTVARDVEITSAKPVIYHVDGEPFVGGASITARVRAGALRVRAPFLAGHSTNR